METTSSERWNVWAHDWLEVNSQRFLDRFSGDEKWKKTATWIPDPMEPFIHIEFLAWLMKTTAKTIRNRIPTDRSHPMMQGYYRLSDCKGDCDGET